jgi:Ni,Fe-hydrogenase III large subunit
VAFFGRPLAGATVRLRLVLADRDEPGTLTLAAADVRAEYPALTPDCAQAHWFEREIAEQWGVTPKGHPWLKPIRFTGNTAVGVTDFFRVEGEEVHEVAVGPVHAGVIEPGHFRFQCHGERVFHLEISLGYQHRGVERALVGGPNKRTIHLMETLAGDTTVGHATAYCQAVEALAGARVPVRAEVLRGVALELERLANHTGDLGALAGDVGYLPTMSYCGRLRGDFLNMSARLCGSRFGRGMVRPGGVGFDADASRLEQLREHFEATMRDVTGAVELLWASPSVMARFEDTGRLSQEVCDELGLVGPAARACGAERDVRSEFPSGIFRFAQVPLSTWHTGDVAARAYVRWLEIQRSAAFIREQLQMLPGGPVRAACGALAPNRIVVSLVEGWRGEICHVAITDAAGPLAHYKVVDPSFHNWIGLAMALRGQRISDFPLCNKSFNLSYCGHDL